MSESVTLLSPGDEGGATRCLISEGNKLWQMYRQLESPTLEKRMSAEHSILQLPVTQCIIYKSDIV